MIDIEELVQLKVGAMMQEERDRVRKEEVEPLLEACWKVRNNLLDSVFPSDQDRDSFYSIIHFLESAIANAEKLAKNQNSA